MGSKARRESDLRSLSDLYLSHLLSRISAFLKRNRTKTKSDCRVLSARFSIFDQDCYSSISLFQRIKKSQPKPQDCFSIFEVSRLAQTYQRYVKEETSVADRYSRQEFNDGGTKTLRRGVGLEDDERQFCKCIESIHVISKTLLLIYKYFCCFDDIGQIHSFL